jgi:hypothetical protein
MMPVERRPAMDVVVRQWPNGAASISRSPLGLQKAAGSM